MNKKVLGIGITLVVIIIAGVLIWNKKNYEQVNEVSNATEEILNEIEEDDSSIESLNWDDWKDAKWVTYRDEENGFEFQYPDSHFLDKNFYYIDYQEGDFAIRHIATSRHWQENNVKAAEVMKVIISIRDKNENISLNTWFSNFDRGSYDVIEPYNAVENINALRVSESSIMSNDAIYFDLGNKVVELHGQGVGLGTKDGDNFFAEMLKTFKEIK
jgi:uncharacterized protein YxeA